MARQTSESLPISTSTSNILPSFSLPSDFPTLSLPSVSLDIPTFSLAIPSITLPSLSLPSLSLSSLSFPSIIVPTAVTITFPSPPPLFNSSSNDDNSNVNVPAIVGGVVGTAVGLGLIGCGVLLWLYLRHRRRDEEKFESRSVLDRTPTPEVEGGRSAGDAEKGVRPFDVRANVTDGSRFRLIEL